MDNWLYSKCDICGGINIEPSHFYKEHRIKEESYCLKYLPRYSKLTGKLLPFKSRDFYFNNDFADKNELKKWLKENDDTALDYCLSVIKKRFEDKKIQYIPSFCELKTLNLPTLEWFLKKCDYNHQCKSLGLEKRFDYNQQLEFEDKDFHFIIDSREQKPLKFENSEIKALKYGDYWAEDSEWSNIYIERKGLSDFISTISSGHERFQREIERCNSDKNYLIILVESDFNQALSFEYIPRIKRGKATSDFIFKRVRDLYQKYKNIQFVFLPRSECINFIKKIYNSKVNPESIDWQYTVHTNEI